MTRPRGPRRPLPPLPPDLEGLRCLGKNEVAALLGISPKTLDQGIYGDRKRGVAPWAPPYFSIGRRRLWWLRDVLRWIDQKPKMSGSGPGVTR